MTVSTISTTSSPLANIKPTDRVILVGTTGSGKTYFAQHVLKRAPCLVVMDPKGLINSKEWALEPWDKKQRHLNKGENVRVRIPPQTHEDDWEYYFARIYEIARARKYRPFVVYIDELYGIGPANGSRGLQALYTRGRELGISVWASTQRPKRIPIYALSEAETIILFTTRMPQDVDLMGEMIPDLGQLTNDEHPLRDHNLIVYNVRSDRAVRYDKLKVTKGSASLA